MNVENDNFVVDHKDRNVLDNRKQNLRICSQQENKYNNSKQSNNTTGVVGVYWYKPYQKWKAQIKIHNKNIFLGYFDVFEEAVKSRKDAEEKYFGEFAPIFNN